MNEVTLKDVYEIIGNLEKKMDQRFGELDRKVEKYHDAFIKFEEGKLTQALQDIEMLKANMKQGASDSERRKNWYWGALEKIIFTLIGALIFLAGLVLTKLGILNLK